MRPDPKNLLLNKVESILKSEPNRMFSKEEILNLLSYLQKDEEVEQILAELEVASGWKGITPSVTAKCKGGTVYYNWKA